MQANAFLHESGRVATTACTGFTAVYFTAALTELASIRSIHAWAVRLMCRGEGGWELDRFERGWVDAHADLGVERDGGIAQERYSEGCRWVSKSRSEASIHRRRC